MEFEQSVNDFFYIFYFLGLTPLCPSTAHPSHVVDALPSLAHLLLLIGAGGVSVYAQLRLSVFKEAIDAFVCYLLIGSEFVLDFTTIAQAIFYRKQFKKLYGQYIDMQKFITLRMERRICFRGFRSEFICQITVVLLILLVTVSSRLTMFSRITNRSLDGGLMYLHSVSTLVQLHSIMHVHLMNFFYRILLKCLSNQAPSIVGLHVYQEMSIDQLQQIKIMHYKLWKVSTKINRIFGWSNLLIIVKNIIHIGYFALTIYWINLYNLDADSLWTYSRKYDCEHQE